MTQPTSEPLSGYRVGVTAARKAEEQVGLLRRRGAEVVCGPALSKLPNRVDDAVLRPATESVLADAVDVVVATTGVGMSAWLEAADSWGCGTRLRERLGAAEILARGPKAVGALRRHGLRELWAPASERFEDLLEHLRGRDLQGRRIVVQEHGQSLSMVAHALRMRGADVVTVPVYRLLGAEDPGPLFSLIDQVADRRLDAVTFTAAPAFAALMEAAHSTGRREEVLTAFQADVVVSTVGPVTAEACELWGVPCLVPDRYRLTAMVRQLELTLPARRQGVAIDVAGHRLLLLGEEVLVDGYRVTLSPAPAAVLDALTANPGQVVSRSELLSVLPGGGSSEHAVEMAVARLRAAIGTRLVQTVVKRGYRLAVGS